MSISAEEGEGKWPTAGSLAMLDEHLTDLAAYKWAASQLLSAAQRDLKHKLQNLMEQLTVSAGKTRTPWSKITFLERNLCFKSLRSRRWLLICLCGERTS